MIILTHFITIKLNSYNFRGNLKNVRKGCGYHGNQNERICNALLYHEVSCFMLKYNLTITRNR